jgi:hypothetical protein
VATNKSCVAFLTFAAAFNPFAETRDARPVNP